MENKDFNIAKFLKENKLGSYGMLRNYVDLKPLKEEEIAEALITVKDTGAVTDRGDVYTRILKWMYSSFGPAKGQYDIQKKGRNVVINTGKLSKDDVAELNDFLDEYIRGGGEYDEVREDVTPEEVAEVPYQGSDDNLTGLGDEDSFEQEEIISEAPARIEWEDLDDTDISGQAMEMDIIELIDRVEESIQIELTNDAEVSQLNPGNPMQTAAQIRLLIKKLWLQKIQEWGARNRGMYEMYDQAEPQAQAQAGTEEDVLAAMITALQDAGFSKQEIEQLSHTISNDPSVLDFGEFSEGKKIQEGVLDNLYTKFHNAVKGAREWAGKKGIQFKVRRPTDEEYDIADQILSKVDAIGVDSVTGNIYAYDGETQHEYIISAEGKVLSKKEGYGI